MAACPCQCREKAKPRRWSRGLTWLAPTVVLALTPKCPACVVAYVAIFTGLGMSLTVATYVRTGVITLAIIALIWVSTMALWQRLRRDVPAVYSLTGTREL